MKRFCALFAAVIALLSGSSARLDAQAYQCRLPQRVSAADLANPAPDGPVRRLPIAGYTLALSWSPEFCRTRADSPRQQRQCSGTEGSFGFVLHGLWPEGRGRQYPQWCPTRQIVSPQAARQQLCVMPSLSLITHEWTKHGACMARTPEGYYTASNALFNSIAFPAMEALSRQPRLTVADFKQAFAEQNPAFPADRIAVKNNRRGWLEEVQLCYNRDFMPARCPAHQRGAPDGARLQIYRGL